MKVDKEFLLTEGRKLLTNDGLNGIRWPEPSVQRGYTGADGEVLLKRTIDFIEKLAQVVPDLEEDRWEGLDFGVGFGRVASVLSLFGSPSQLTCADAWQKSLDLATSGGLTNPKILLTPKITAGSLPASQYDFAYAYSIFTHLPDAVFIHNIRALVDSLKPGGTLVFTVREPRFIEFLQRSNKYKPEDGAISNEGYWFGNAQSADYGDTIVTSEWIARNLGEFGTIENHGVAPSEPFQCILSLTKPTWSVRRGGRSS